MEKRKRSSTKTTEKAAPNHLLKEQRIQHYWTQSQVAEKIGTTVVNVNRWEHGVTFPTLYFRQKLCELFGKTPEELGLIPEKERQLQIKDIANPPSPVWWNVPFRRNPFFTDREEILSRMQTALEGDRVAAIAQTQAISGLGGIGKTQTAVEYAYRYQSRYQAVLWVKADSREILTSDFVTLADLLNLPEKGEQDQNRTIRAVKDWLKGHIDWLLILDNVEDLEMAGDFLPSPSKGHILLTTRVQTIGTLAQRIELEKLEPEEGALLLLRRTKRIAPDASLEQTPSIARANALELSQLMDGLPLALDQAAAYIEETDCGLAGYLSRYQTRRTKLLNMRGGSALDHPEPVVTTWSLSFEKVQQANLAAADLLRLCAFLHPDAIPEEIITEGASELGSILELVADDPLELDMAIRELRRFSLMKRDPESQVLIMHRLVQIVLKDGMGEETERHWAERTVRVVNHALPEDVVVATWQRWQRCLPHAQACAALIEQWDMVFPEALHLLHQTGRYLRERAQFAQAEIFYKQMLALYDRIFGPERLETTAGLDALADVYFQQGKYILAESLYRQALTIREKALSPNHPAIASNLNNLAHLLYFNDSSKYDEAQQLHLQALTIHEATLEKEHLEIALDFEYLGDLYHYQGKFDEALQYYQRSLEIREKLLGPNHPDVASSLYCVALIYHLEDKYEQAALFYQRALAIREALEPDHPEVGRLLDNLGILSTEKGCYDQAEQYFKRSLATHEKVFGMVHPHIAKCLDNFALLYLAVARYSEAEVLIKRALSIHEQTVGPDHADVAIVLNTLAEIYLAQGKHAQTKPLLRRALSVLQKDQRPNHPLLAATYRNMAELSFAEGNYKEALKLYLQAKGIFEKALGATSLDTAQNLNSLAKTYLALDKYDQAESFCRRALNIREKKLGSEHPLVAQSLNTLATICLSQRELDQAEQYGRQALTIFEQFLGPKHPYVVQCLSTLAQIYCAQSKYTLAEPLYRRVLNIGKKTLKPEDPNIAIALENYAIVLREMNRDTEAMKLEARAKTIRSKSIQENQP